MCLNQNKQHKTQTQTCFSSFFVLNIGDDLDHVEEVVTTTSDDLLVPMEHGAELEEEEEEDDDPQDRLTKDEVVNCICQINEENGLMIQVSWTSRPS